MRVLSVVCKKSKNMPRAKLELVPAILSSEQEVVQQQLLLASQESRFRIVQIDIADGQLVETLTVTPYDVKDLDFTRLQVDFHLMTQDPLDYVWEIAAQGAALPVRAILGQVERMSDQMAFVEACKEYGYQAGLALDLATPVESVEPEMWTCLDKILLLSVPMGAQGQKFSELIWDKIATVRQQCRQCQSRCQIIVDGGVRPDLLPDLIANEVSEVAIGSYMWRGNFRQNCDALWQMLN